MTEHLTVAAEIKAQDGEAGTFTGLASTFGNKDLVGDIIRRGAFRDSLSNVKAIRMLWQHDPGSPIGTWESMRETDAGLEVKGRLVMGTQRGREAFELMKADAIDALSIGFSIPEGGATTDRRSGVRTISKINLLEVSVVTFPANPKARIEAAKAAGTLPARADVQKSLQSDFGLSVRAAKRVASSILSELSPEAAEAERLLDSVEYCKRILRQ